MNNETKRRLDLTKQECDLIAFALGYFVGTVGPRERTRWTPEMVMSLYARLDWPKAAR